MAEKSFLDRAAAYTYNELERLGGDLSKLDTAANCGHSVFGTSNY
jgi:hypothetical protein